MAFGILGVLVVQLKATFVMDALAETERATSIWDGEKRLTMLYSFMSKLLRHERLKKEHKQF